MSFQPDDDSEELAHVARLPAPYRDASKSLIRSRVNRLLERQRLSKAKFSKLLNFQRTRISMVLHNSYQSEAIVVYARFARWLAVQDARLVWSVVYGLEYGANASHVSESFEGRLMKLLKELPSQLTHMNANEKANALGDALRAKANAPVLDRFAKSLSATMASFCSTNLSNLANCRQYLICTLPIETRTEFDRHVLAWLETVGEPRTGWFHQQHVGVSDATLSTRTKPTSTQKRVRRVAEEREEQEEDEEEEVERYHGNDEEGQQSDEDPYGYARPMASSRSSTHRRRSSHLDSSPRHAQVTMPKKRPSSVMSRNDLSSTSTRVKRRKRARSISSDESEDVDASSPSPSPSPSGGESAESESDSGEEESDSQIDSRHRRSRSDHPDLNDRSRLGPSRSSSSVTGGPRTGYDLNAYTPPVFLKSSMSKILSRLSQVLNRDGISRRQVALKIGISQSKISRLLHGRSPFRTEEEEFHLRHWLYLREKAWIQQLDTTMHKYMAKDNLIDFSNLPSPIQTIQPPQKFVLYLHFLLPLNQRAAIDAIVAQALGKDIDAVEQIDSDDASESPIEATSDVTPTGDANINHLDALPAPNATSQSVDAPTRRGKLVDEDESLTADRRRLTGVSAWKLASRESVRQRLSAMMHISEMSQASLACLLNLSNASVSMILRGTFRFSSLDDHLAQVRSWGEEMDRLIVSKALSLLGSDHDSIDLPFTASDDPIERAILIRTIQPLTADTYYARLLGHENDDEDDDAEILDAEADEASTQHGSETASPALKEMVGLLAQADIPLETPEDDETTNITPSSSSLTLTPAPLSLWSWLSFTCSFSVRPRMDRILVPWIERWSGVDSESIASVTLYRRVGESAKRFQQWRERLAKGDRNMPMPYRSVTTVKENTPIDVGTKEEEEEEEEEESAMEQHHQNQVQAQVQTSPPPVQLETSLTNQQL